MLRQIAFLLVLLFAGFTNLGASEPQRESGVTTVVEKVSYGPWHPSGVSHDPRISATMTLLPSGKVLVVGGLVTQAEVWDPATGMFAVGPSLLENRGRHTATLLTSGRVLVVGGRDADENTMSTVEIYDAAKSNFATAAPLPGGGRDSHTATLLPDSGEVLVVGGLYNDTALKSALVYNDDMNSWQEVAQPNVDRRSHTATLLTDSRVVVAGGYNDSNLVLDHVEIYDGGVWTEPGVLQVARRSHTATALNDGRILVAGGLGEGSTNLDEAEIYDPSNGTSITIASLNQARNGHTAVLLRNGLVMVIGGLDGADPLSSAEYYDFDLSSWVEVDPMTDGRFDHGSVLLPSGDVFVMGGPGLRSSEIFLHHTSAWASSTIDLVGGRNTHTANLLPSGNVLIAGDSFLSGMTTEIYDPVTQQFAFGAGLKKIRSRHTSTLLPSGEVLLAGGDSSDVHAELYDGRLPLHSTRLVDHPMSKARQDHTATLLPSGNVLVVGGVGSAGAEETAELFITADLEWTAAGTLSNSRVNHSSTLLASGEVLIAGGGSSSVEVYDPRTQQWSLGSPMISSRADHSATLLANGDILAAGGVLIGADSAEIYSSQSREWSSVSPMLEARKEHAAVLLPSGKVLVMGGTDDNGNSLASAEVYDPSTDTWTLVPLPVNPIARRGHTATLLSHGDVLVSGGAGASSVTAQLFMPADLTLLSRPTLSSASSVIYSEGLSLTIAGSGFRGKSEASHGQLGNSATNFPLVRLISLEDPRIFHVTPDDVPNVGNDPTTLEFSELPPGLTPGHHLISVNVAGIPSEALVTDVQCGNDGAPTLNAINATPADVFAYVDGVATVSEGAQVTFTVDSQSGRSFTWKKNGNDLPVNGNSYTTDVIIGSDTGSVISVTVDSGCRLPEEVSALIQVHDESPPNNVNVLSPRGGEYWPLSNADETYEEFVSWQMDDNIRICYVTVDLLLEDSSGDWQVVSNSNFPGPYGDDPAVHGPCQAPGVTEAGFSYSMPTEPPRQVNGVDIEGFRYKVRVTVTDHAGNPTLVESGRPFFMVPVDEDAFDTLIITHSHRQILAENDLLGTGASVSDDEANEFIADLQVLADHLQVRGFVVDLATRTSLDALYEAWDDGWIDGSNTSPTLANNVLFGTESSEGIHGVILEILQAYSGVEYLVIAGDDRVIPMARILDDTVDVTEKVYTMNGDLDPLATTVGQALNANHYLTDDFLGYRREVRLGLLGEEPFLPELAVGRLVETRTEMNDSIAGFISSGAVLNLGHDDYKNSKVLVTAYDFLRDSGKLIYERWLAALEVDAADPQVNGQLINDWPMTGGNDEQEAQLQALHDALNGGYGIFSLNGHATHDAEGIPNTFTPMEIDGLKAYELTDVMGCSDNTRGEVDLNGSILYALGCHGGLPVPGACGDDMDLPQAMLRQGALAYVANSGYGWGLRDGIGYSERLLYLMTQELSTVGVQSIGQAVRRAKERYYLEGLRFNAFDEKILHQWTLFGLPMYEISDAGTPLPDPYDRSASIDRRPSTVRVGNVIIEHSPVDDTELPPFLLPWDFGFRLDAEGIYVKRAADGSQITDPNTNCGDVGGCYYTLFNLFDQSTGEADLPIQPYVVYDYRLTGNSTRGLLWLGGRYSEEDDWTPVFGSLETTDSLLDDHGSTPRFIRYRPSVRRRFPTNGDGSDCRAADTDLSTMVIATGEVFKTDKSSDHYDVQRLFDRMEFVSLFYNNTEQPSQNCDRLGPEITAPKGEGYHSVQGRLVKWKVEANDQMGGDVWRVVVVWDDKNVNEWKAVELTEGLDGFWHAELNVPAGFQELSYVIQAVDTRGNVEWTEYVVAETELPASGQPFEIPEVMDAALMPADVNLSLQVNDGPDPATIYEEVSFSISAANSGQDNASDVKLTISLPTGVTLAKASGDGWLCQEVPAGPSSTVLCERDIVENRASVTVWVQPPALTGTIMTTFSVSSQGVEHDEVTVETTIVVPEIFDDGFSSGDTSAWSGDR